VTYYRQLRKRFLSQLDDDFLIGSTISTVSKIDESYVSKISSPSILTGNTEMAKRSATSNKHDFYPKNFNYEFLPKPVFKNYRNDVKKIYEDDKNMLDVNQYQMTDHSITFMKMITMRENAMSATNRQRRQVLIPRVIWDGVIDRIEVFRNNVEGPYGKIGEGYLFDTGFKSAYFERGTDCYVDLWMKYHQLSRLRKMHVHCMAHYSVLVKVV
jgi:hypothetical protein